MTEPKSEYTVEVNEALDMLGKGYKPRKIVQEVSGFYPLFEALLEKYDDLITPAVFGVAWRFCQMQDGVCKASLRTIAGILNIGEATVMRRMEVLCDDGYLKDLTPGLKHRPHIYADTGLVVMKSSLGVSESVSQGNTSVSGRNATVSRRNRSVSQNRLSKVKDSNKDSNREGRAYNFRDMTVGQAHKVPTLKLYAEAAEYFPGSILWEKVHNAIVEHNLTFERIHAAAVAWAGRGFKPSNVDGILEWAVNGIPSNGHKSKAEPPAPVELSGSDLEAERERVRQMIFGGTQ